MAYRIYCWPPEEASSLAIPGRFDVLPASLGSLPRGSIVMVPAAHREAFERAIVTQFAEHPPTAILLAEAGAEEPAADDSIFRAIVPAGDWDRLDDLLAHPLQFEVADWASEIPTETLDRLDSDFPEKSADVARLRRLLPADVEADFEAAGILEALQDPAYRHIFRDALHLERALRWALRTPTTRDLANYVRGRLSLATEPYIKAYLERSENGRVTVEVLRRQLLDIPLLQASIARLAEAGADVDALRAAATTEAAATLVAFIFGLARSELRMRQLGAFRGPEGKPVPMPKTDVEITAQASERLLKGMTVTLVETVGEERHELDLRFDPDVPALVIEKVQQRAGESKRVFFVELCPAEGDCWRAASTGGRAEIPLDSLGDLLSRGPVTLSIQSA